MILEKFRNTLIQFKEVTEKIIVSYPITGIKDSSNSILIYIDCKKLGNPEFEEFGLIRFRELLELLRIVDDKDLNILFKDNILYIKSPLLNCKYVTTDISILEEDSRVKESILNNIKEQESIITFILNIDILDKLKKISMLLNLEDININIPITGDNINMVLSNINDTSISDNIEFNIKPVAVESKKTNETEHKILLNLNNLKKIPLIEYKISIKQNSKNKDNYVLLLTPNNDEEILYIILACKSIKR